MAPVILDPATVKKLLTSMRTVDVSDESGKVVGHFTPALDMTDYELVGPEISDDELRRRAQSTGPRYTTAEVLKLLDRR